MAFAIAGCAAAVVTAAAGVAFWAAAPPPRPPAPVPVAARSTDVGLVLAAAGRAAVAAPVDGTGALIVRCRGAVERLAGPIELRWMGEVDARGIVVRATERAWRRATAPSGPPARATPAGADAIVTFERVRAGLFQIRVPLLEGSAVLAPARVPLSGARATSEIWIPATGTGSIDLRLVDADGGPVPARIARVVGEVGQLPVYLDLPSIASDDDGHLVLTGLPGRDVTVAATWGRAARATGRFLLPAETPTTWRLATDASTDDAPPTSEGRITGRVIQAGNGSPVPGALVAADWARSAAADTQPRASLATRADADGRFVFDGLGAGHTTVYVHGGGWLSKALLDRRTGANPLHVATDTAGRAAVELEVLVGASVAGRVVRGGRAATGAIVRIWTPQTEGGLDPLPPVFTVADADGRFATGGLVPDLPHVADVVNALERGSVAFVTRAAITRDVTIDLEAPAIGDERERPDLRADGALEASILLRPLLPEDRAPQHLEVEWERLDDGPPANGTAWCSLDSSGRGRVDVPTEGRYRLAFSGTHDPGATGREHRVTLEGVTGTATTTVDLRGPHDPRGEASGGPHAITFAGRAPDGSGVECGNLCAIHPYEAPGERPRTFEMSAGRIFARRAMEIWLEVSPKGRADLAPMALGYIEVGPSGGERVVHFPRARKIDVRVVDELGAPVAGVLVRARGRYPERVERGASVEGGDHATGLTDTDGRLALAGLAPRPYGLVATVPAPFVDPPPVEVSATEAATTFTLRRSVSARIRVFAPGGVPLAGASVAVWPVGQPARFPLLQTHTSRRTDSDGIAILTHLDPAVTYTLGVDDVPGSQPLFGIQRTPWAPADTEVTLDDELQISGRVLDVSGRPVADATVVGERGRMYGRSAHDGSFRVERLRPGTLVLHARHGTLTGPAVSTRAGATDVALDVPASVIVRVRIAHALESSEQVPVRVVASARRHASLAASAEGRSPVLVGAFAPGESIRVVVGPTADGHFGLVEAIAQVDEVVVPLTVGGEIAGRCMDVTGAPVEGATIYGWNDAGPVCHSTADREGRFRLRGLGGLEAHVRADFPSAFGSPGVASVPLERGARGDSDPGTPFR